MNIVEFLKTIYVGDQGCKSILIDGWLGEVKMQVTCISRVRGGTWNYYSAEDLPDGFIVFEGVKSISFNPQGLIPNDSINDIQAELIATEKTEYLVSISVDSVNEIGEHTEIQIQIRTESMALEASGNVAQRIRQ